jgi:hypothetical protein
MGEDHRVDACSDLARMRELIGHDHDRLDPQVARATIGEPLKDLQTARRAIPGESVRGR